MPRSVGAGDGGMSLRALGREDEMEAVEERVRLACLANGVAFLGHAEEDTVQHELDRGVRNFSGATAATMAKGREITGRAEVMPV